MKKKLLVLLASATAASLALAATPFRETVSMSAGSGTYTHSTDYVGRTINYVVMGGEAGQTTTVYVVLGSITNDVGSKVIAAGDYVYWPGTNYVLFHGDKLIFSSTDTNAHNNVVGGTQEP